MVFQAISIKVQNKRLFFVRGKKVALKVLMENCIILQLFITRNHFANVSKQKELNKIKLLFYHKDNEISNGLEKFHYHIFS